MGQTKKARSHSTHIHLAGAVGVAGIFGSLALSDSSIPNWKDERRRVKNAKSRCSNHSYDFANSASTSAPMYRLDFAVYLRPAAFPRVAHCHLTLIKQILFIRILPPSPPLLDLNVFPIRANISGMNRVTLKRRTG